MTLFPTASGRMIDPFDLKPSDVSIDDIAESLAKINRYLGHTPDITISVAFHSLRIADMLIDTPHELYGLLHDAAEAYIGDWPGPWKHRVYVIDRGSYAPLTAIEDRIVNTIYDGLEIERPSYDTIRAVKAADEEDRKTERDRMFWNPDWVQVRDMFLDRYHRLAPSWRKGALPVRTNR